MMQTESQAPSVVTSPYLNCEAAAANLWTTKQVLYSLVKRGRLKPMPGRPGRLLSREKPWIAI